MGELYRSADLMADALKRGYCVPAYDTNDIQTTQMVFRAAEKAQTPVIIMAYPGHGVDFKLFADMVLRIGSKAKVPFALHLDHAPDFETVMRAIQGGFTSVMIDASKLPYEENVRECRRVIDVCRAMNIDVEGELGYVGRDEEVRTDGYTNPAEAARFVADTGLDTLAVAIGNCHGVYKGEPHMEIGLLEEIKAAVPGVPLVLHGASGIPKDQLMDACRHGICKTNVATEYLMKYAEVIRANEAKEPSRNIGMMLARAFDEVTDFIADKMLCFNPDGLKLL